MKKIILFLLPLIFIFASCANKEENSVFYAKIDDVMNDSIMVTTDDDSAGFDWASVVFDEDIIIETELSAGKTVLITILPDIRESYPVGVTAIKIQDYTEK